MKILFLSHPITIEPDHEESFGAYPPLGLAYMASMLEKQGHEVKIIDSFAEGIQVKQQRGHKIKIGLKDGSILSQISEFTPDIVGISNNFTTFHEDAYDLAVLIKRNFPEILLVGGGNHMTQEYEKIMDKSYFDMIVRGEGEYPMLEMVDHLERNKSFSGIKGLVWREKDGTVKVNEMRNPPENLDAIPFPAYHLLNMNLYIHQKTRNFAYCMAYPVGHVMTSRGCYYSCTFCSTVKHFKTFRIRSPENVLDEMEFLMQNYGIKEFHFHDDSYLCDPKRAIAISEGMIERGMKIFWQASQGVTVWGLKPEMLPIMKKSGMYRLGLPIETGSQKTLKLIKKPVKLEKTLEIIKECNRLGIYTHGNFIIGFPYETQEDIQMTADYINKSNLDFVKLLICQPLAGAQLYSIYNQEGLLGDTPIASSTYEKTKYNTTVFTAFELNDLRKNISKDYQQKNIRRLIKPSGIQKFILPKLKSKPGIKFFLKMVFLASYRVLVGKPVFGV
ncbi:MAG: B12-binding domain-containing radical SAM protein [Nitrospina sp.]|nr:B12-binding domain-containing radical SAM protein [Nitrospina sp.]